MLTSDSIKIFEIKTLSTNSQPIIYSSYILKNINKGNQVQELLFDLIDIINQTNNQNQNYHFLIQILYYIIQNSNIIIKCNFNTSLINHNISRNFDQKGVTKVTPISNFNYLFILNNKSIFQFDYKIFNKLVKNTKNLAYLCYYLNLNQDIQNQAFYISNWELVSTLIYKKLLKHKSKKSLNCPIFIHNGNINVSKNISTFNYVGKKNNGSLNKRTYTIKKNRKIRERNLLKKKESLHNISSGDSSIAKKKGVNNKMSLSYLYNKNINMKKGGIKKYSFHSNFKRLNNKIVSKYYLYQKGKKQFKIFINNYSLMEDQVNFNSLSDKEKVKNFFKGKYFKNFYQKINYFQNNLREYVNNENNEAKQDHNCFCNKILNINFKNSKSKQSGYQFNKKNNSFSSSLSQTNLSENRSNETNFLDSIKSDHNQVSIIENSNKINDDTPSNLSISYISFNSTSLSPKVVAASAVTTTINVENSQYSNNKFKVELNQSIKYLKNSTKYQNQNFGNKITEKKESKNIKKDVIINNENIDNNNNITNTNSTTTTTTTTTNNNNNKNNINNNNHSIESLRKQSINKSSTSKDVIEKSIVLPSSEVIKPSLPTNSDSIINSNSLEKEINSISNTSLKRNRKSKHSRSSAVCLSSSDIKGILDQTKKEEISSNQSIKSSRTVERNLNDSIKYQKGFFNTSISKDSLERRKLLSRNNYHPSLVTLSTTQFCYSDYCPSIRLPLMPRSSSFYSARPQLKQQPWINHNKLNV